MPSLTMKRADDHVWGLCFFLTFITGIKIIAEAIGAQNKVIASFVTTNIELLFSTESMYIIPNNANTKIATAVMNKPQSSSTRLSLINILANITLNTMTMLENRNKPIPMKLGLRRVKKNAMNARTGNRNRGHVALTCFNCLSRTLALPFLGVSLVRFVPRVPRHRPPATFPNPAYHKRS